MAKNISEHVAEATDSNSNDFVEDLIEGLSNFMTELEFQCKDIGADKLRQYEEVRKKMRKTNKHCTKYFAVILCNLENSVIRRWSIWR